MNSEEKLRTLWELDRLSACLSPPADQVTQAWAVETMRYLIEEMIKVEEADHD